MGAGRLEEGLITGLTLTEHMVLAAPEHTFVIDWKTAKDATSTQIKTYQVPQTQRRISFQEAINSVLCFHCCGHL